LGFAVGIEFLLGVGEVGLGVGTLGKLGMGRVGNRSLEPKAVEVEFFQMEEVQEFATRWMWSHNNDRPNMALGGFTPKQKLAMAA
jgi:hypothetical protein